MTVSIEKRDIHATLTTWIYCAMAQMWVLEKMGYKGYINWPEGLKSLSAYQDRSMFNQVPNMFEWYFIQPHADRGYSDVWTWEDMWPPAKHITDQLYGQPLAEIRRFYKTHLFFSDAVENRGEALVKKYGIDFSKTIGITWRGTDVYLDDRPRMPIETYFKFIDQALEITPDARIMCTAEEDTILDPLLKRYPQAFKVEEFLSSPFQSKHNPERLTNVSGFERGLQPALMVWMFSKCAHYIKNRSSTGAVASWISNGRIVSLGHGENLGFPANTDTAEIEGKQYPL